MSHILLINYEYPPIGAGAANATFHMANALLELGHIPVVVTTAYDGNPGTLNESGVTVCRIPSRRKHPNKSNLWEMASFMWSLTFNLRRIVHAHHPEGAIIFFSFPCGPIGLVLRRFFDIPYLVSLRGGDVPGTEPRLAWLYWLLTPLRRWVFRQSDAVIANSTGLADLSRRADPYPVKVIPNGVDTDFWSPGDEKSDTGQFNILFVGRFHPQKNLHYLLDEFAIFLKQMPDAQLTLVGDGPDADSLKAHARGKGIDDMVHWRNWSNKQELREYYRSADCLVNPSHYEGMPNVLLEAMACGTRVIASDIPGNNEVIEDGVTGWLYQPADAHGLQTTLLRLLNTDTSGITEHARRTMTRDYSWRNVGSQYLNSFSTIKPVTSKPAGTHR